jgi:hypothetical protein
MEGSRLMAKAKMTSKQMTTAAAFEEAVDLLKEEWPSLPAEILDDYEIQRLWVDAQQRATYVTAIVVWRRRVEGRLADLERRLDALEHRVTDEEP